MSRKKQRSALGEVLSLFRQRKVQLEVRVADLGDGTVGIKAVFLVDGDAISDVDAAEPGLKKAIQRHVDETPQAQFALATLKQMRLRLSKPKAAAAVQALKRHGVSPRNRDGTAFVNAVSVTANVALQMARDDGLKVISTIVSADGGRCEKPESVKQLRADDGWYWSGGDLVRVALTRSSLDQLLYARNGNGTLLGDDVLRCLRLIEKHRLCFGNVVKDQAVEALRVLSPSVTAEIIIDATEHSLSIEPRLRVALTEGKTYSFSDADLPELRKHADGFLRVQEGWVPLAAETVEKFLALWQRVTDITSGHKTVHGDRVPVVLLVLEAFALESDAVRFVWRPSIETLHPRRGGPWDVRLELDIEDADGQPRLRLTPTYTSGEHVLPHAVATRAVGNRTAWIRDDGVWVRVDRQLVERVEQAARVAELDSGNGGYTYSPAKRQVAATAFGGFARVVPSAVYRQSVQRQIAVDGSITLEGTAESLVLTPQLTLRAESGEVRSFDEAGINALAAGVDGLVRVGGKWLEFDALRVKQFAAAWNAVLACTGGKATVHGADIPAAFEALNTARKRLPLWLAFTYANGIEGLHRRETGPWAVRCEFDIEEVDGQPRFRLTPTYTSGEHAISHDAALRAVEGGHAWIRVDKTWVRVDRRRVERVQDAANALALDAIEGGYRFPPGKREPVRAAFKAIASAELLSDAYRGNVQRVTVAGGVSIGGTADQLVLSSRLSMVAESGQTYRLNDAAIEKIAKRADGFARLGKVWGEFDPVPVRQFVTGWESLLSCTGGKTTVSGADIPEALVSLNEATQALPPWIEVTRSSAIDMLHRRETGPWAVRCEFDIDDVDGQPRFRLTPTYSCGRHRLRFADVHKAVRRGQSWLRVDETWAHIDSRIHTQVTSAAADLELRLARDGLGYAFAPGQREDVTAAFARFGEVGPSQRYRSSVLTGAATGRVSVDATENTLTVDPRLSLVTQGHEPCELTAAQVDELDKNAGICRQGSLWLAIDPLHAKHLASIRRAVASRTGQQRQVDGDAIPEVLSLLDGLAAEVGGSVAIERTPAVETYHRRVREPWQATVDVDIEEVESQPILKLTPRLGGQTQTHALPTVARAVAEGRTWLRVGNTWHYTDALLCDRVQNAFGTLPLGTTAGGQAYVCDPANRHVVFDALRRVANVVFSSNYQRSVIEGQAEGVITVDATQDEMTVSRRLTVKDRDGRTHAFADDNLPVMGETGQSLLRHGEAWIDVSPRVQEAFVTASRQVDRCTAGRSRIPFREIPEVLGTLDSLCITGVLETDPARHPVTVEFTQGLRDGHRRVTSEGTVEYRLGVVDAGGTSLLHLDPVYDQERFKLSQSEVRAALDAGEEWIRKPGAWIRVPARNFRKVRRLSASLGLETTEEGFAVSPLDHARVVDAFSASGTVVPMPTYTDFICNLNDFTTIENASLPARMQPAVKLRDYQRHGYNWLVFLQRYGFSGILADDMGLGKTLQTLLAIEHRNDRTEHSLPSLIICPASVLFNWEREIQKFLVDAEVYLYHGTTGRRSVERLRRTADAAKQSGRSFYVLTSYDTARIDRKTLETIRWRYLVVDEAHHIKNPSARRTQAIKSLPAHHRLALTGTPVQNSLQDLWSLFDFAMPGFLGHQAAFASQYGKSLGVSATGKHQELAKRVKPFLLRRLKSHVAKDLPEKIIVDARVELTSRQVHLYKDVLASRDRREVLEQIESQGVGRSRIAMFALLSKLRTICNHPALALGIDRPTQARVSDSGKLAYLKELLEEITGGDHRALLFSQSTRMLDVIQHCFDAWQVSYVRLDGRTPPSHRGGLAERFNTDQTVDCFLLSTKAAGVGLNLVGADTVIFYDHDWNPANDSQAMDRAYRIGQTRNVTVYRLISAGTIEDKILERQASKQALADEVVGVDVEGFKNITREEVAALLRYDP